MIAGIRHGVRGSQDLTKRVVFKLLWVGAAACFLMACSRLTALKEMEASQIAAAQNVVDRLQTTNQFLKSFKGTGKISLRQNGVLTLDQRVAWVGAEPVKLSIVLLVSGFPAVRIASDGSWLYYVDSQDPKGSYRKIRTNDPSLERILAIPINASDVIRLLSGRIPLREYDTAILESDTAGPGFVLVLRKWWGIVAKVYVDSGRSTVRQVEVFERRGSLAYRAVFEQMQWVSDYQVPQTLALSNDNGAYFQLIIDRYWADVEVSPSMFVVPAPD
jgi:hypothetical protein